MVKNKLGYYLRSMIKEYKTIMEKELFIYRINIGHFTIMDIVYKENGILQEVVSSMLVADRTTISRRITQLEKLGYMKKEKDDKDKRAYRLYQTEKGNEVYEKAKKIRDEINKIGAKGVTQEEFQIAAKTLMKINNNLKEI